MPFNGISFLFFKIMFSWFKKKKKEEILVGANAIDNNINTVTIGSGEVSIEFINGEKNGLAKPSSREDVSTEAPNFSIDNFIEAPKGLGKSKPKKSITKNRVLKRDENQGSRVLSILKDNPEGLTRYEIKDVYIKQFGDILDTSLSRAIACLSYDTAITMTDITKLERYGKVCHIYKAN